MPSLLKKMQFIIWIIECNELKKNKFLFLFFIKNYKIFFCIFFFFYIVSYASNTKLKSYLFLCCTQIVYHYSFTKKQRKVRLLYYSRSAEKLVEYTHKIQLLLLCGVPGGVCITVHRRQAVHIKTYRIIIIYLS